MQTKQIEFSKLRHAYLIVKHFIEKESEGYNKLESLNTKLATDIGLLGDDNLEFLEKFVSKFELEYSNFEYDKHFHSEVDIFGSEAALKNLLSLSVNLPLNLIELITFKHIKFDKPAFPDTPNEQVLDLTFKDLVTWYIEKEFKHSDEVKYEIVM